MEQGISVAFIPLVSCALNGTGSILWALLVSAEILRAEEPESDVSPLCLAVASLICTWNEEAANRPVALHSRGRRYHYTVYFLISNDNDHRYHISRTTRWIYQAYLIYSPALHSKAY